MYVLAKKVNGSDGVTIHGLTDNAVVCDAWHAAGQVVFDIDPEDTATYGPHEPIDGFGESETDD